MKRKLVTFLLALCAVFTVGALSACGEESNPTDGANNGEHVHNYTNVVTPPTCTEDGYTTYTCECGDSYQDDEVAALGHTFDNDCTTADKCVNCEVIATANESHTFDNDCTTADKCANCNVVTEAEHIYKDQVCGVCGDIEYTEGLAYTLSNDGTTYEVSGIGECTDTEIIIPARYNNLPVTSIGYEAFSDCNSLTSITIPDSVTSIGYEAFYNCSSLTSITIPDSVTSIWGGAFYYCYKLEKVNYTGTIDDWAMIEFGGYDANPLYYAKHLYINDKEITEVTLTKVTKINAYAFYNYDSLTSITIPDSVTSIGEAAFRDCSNLTSITIPDNVASIENYAFDGCNSLATVYYGGTSEQWRNIDIGSSNTYLTNATRYYYSEEKPTGAGNYWHYVDGVPTKWE